AAATSANARLGTASTTRSEPAIGAASIVLAETPRRSAVRRYRGLCPVSLIARACSASRHASVTSWSRWRSTQEKPVPHEPPPTTTTFTDLESHYGRSETDSGIPTGRRTAWARSRADRSVPGDLPSARREPLPELRHSRRRRDAVGGGRRSARRRVPRTHAEAAARIHPVARARGGAGAAGRGLRGRGAAPADDL